MLVTHMNPKTGLAFVLPSNVIGLSSFCCFILKDNEVFCCFILEDSQAFPLSVV